MWKWIVGILAVVLLLGVGIVLRIMHGPDMSRYEVLNDPRIAPKADMAVLEVPFQVPSPELPKVFGTLMQTYFKLSGVPKGPGMPAPAARYENVLDLKLQGQERFEALKKVVWKGSAAIQVPAGLKALPAGAGSGDLKPQLAEWKYGEVAEILHKGPYETESPTIKRLKEYISAQGYEIAGFHEEEYLRGPGMPFANPKKFYTIIRYPVKKKAAAAPAKH
jgi:hypothetical protein